MCCPLPEIALPRISIFLYLRVGFKYIVIVLDPPLYPGDRRLVGGEPYQVIEVIQEILLLAPLPHVLVIILQYREVQQGIAVPGGRYVP